jgi:hypothetical protein
MKQLDNKEIAGATGNQPATNPVRRALLATAACAPVLAAGVLLAKRSAVPASTVPAVSEAATGTPASVGYHETEHTRKYYRTLASI